MVAAEKEGKEAYAYMPAWWRQKEVNRRKAGFVHVMRSRARELAHATKRVVFF
jgi:hypothetical protein